MNKNESKYFNTAKKMNDALIAILERKDFEYITVKDICEEAKVNRSTFYLHYETTYDLLEEVISNSNKEFNEYFKNKRHPDVDIDSKEKLFLVTDDYLIPYLTFIKNNKKIYRAAKKNPHLFMIDKMFSNVYKNIISKIFDKYNVEEKYKEYVFSFFINGISSIVLTWCNYNCNLNIEEVSSLIKGLVADVSKNQK